MPQMRAKILFTIQKKSFDFMFKQSVLQKQQRQQELRRKLEAEEENDIRPDRRPPNAYLLFCREKRKEDAARDPKQDAMGKNKEYAEMWKNLPEDEKRIYQNRARELFELFRKQNPDFKYKQKKKQTQTQKRQGEGIDLDPLQFLNHMFQNNPLLLQQMVLSDRDNQGKPSAYRLFFPE